LSRASEASRGKEKAFEVVNLGIAKPCRVVSLSFLAQLPRTVIPGVGWLIKFVDTAGNLTCAIRFDADGK
jgi:hypothetical protein